MVQFRLEHYSISGFRNVQTQGDVIGGLVMIEAFGVAKAETNFRVFHKTI